MLATAAVVGGGWRLAQAQGAPATSIYRGPTGAPIVALTFDCGSDTGHAASILSTLASYGLRCSFGMTGMWAERNPGLTLQMVEAGHHLINHTYDHPSFTTGGSGGGPLTYDQRMYQLETTEAIVHNITGVSTKPYFRPPYGEFDDGSLADLGSAGYAWNVLWSIDLMGWASGWDASRIAARADANHGNGYIYLMHVGWASQEAAALPSIIESLAAKGYGFATIPQLMGGTGTPTMPPAAKFVAGDTARVTAALYLRTGPGTGSGVITTMPRDTVCTIVGGPTVANGYSWYQVDTPYGSGWAAGEFLEKTTSTPPPPPPAAKFAIGETVRVTESLNLRSGAGTGYGAIRAMPAGTTCTVTGAPTAANGYTWFPLDTPYGKGWAVDAYLEKTTSAPPPTSGGYLPGQRLKVTAGLYLRTAATLSSSVITTMPTGTVCTVVSGPSPSGGYTWYQVDTPYGRGWAAGEFLTPTDSLPPPTSGGYPAGSRVRVTESLRLRSAATTSAGILNTMPAGTICTVVSGPQAGGGYTWYLLDSPYGRGWAAGEFLAPA